MGTEAEMISISLAAVARASHSREGGRQDLFQISVATRPVVGRPRGGARLRQTYDAARALRCRVSCLPKPVCTENLIRVDDVMESPKLAE